MPQQWSAIHADSHNTLASDPLDSDWIYVGTLGGLPDVDALLESNPYPYAPGDPVGPPPFLNGWNNIVTLGVDAPVSFCITTEGWTYIRGAFTGGVAGTAVFVLPPPFAPVYQQAIVAPISDATSIWIGVVGIDGTVTVTTIV